MILKVEKGDTVWNSFKTAMQKLLSELEIDFMSDSGSVGKAVL